MESKEISVVNFDELADVLRSTANNAERDFDRVVNALNATADKLTTPKETCCACDGKTLQVPRELLSRLRSGEEPLSLAAQAILWLGALATSLVGQSTWSVPFLLLLPIAKAAFSLISVCGNTCKDSRIVTSNVELRGAPPLFGGASPRTQG